MSPVPQLDSRKPQTGKGEGMVNMNELQTWAEKGLLSDSQILEILQGSGIISDNCYKLDQVVNSQDALDFLTSKLGF